VLPRIKFTKEMTLKNGFEVRDKEDSNLESKTAVNGKGRYEANLEPIQGKSILFRVNGRSEFLIGVFGLFDVNCKQSCTHCVPMYLH